MSQDNAAGAPPSDFISDGGAPAAWTWLFFRILRPLFGETVEPIHGFLKPDFLAFKFGGFELFEPRAFGVGQLRAFQRAGLRALLKLVCKGRASSLLV